MQSVGARIALALSLIIFFVGISYAYPLNLYSDQDSQTHFRRFVLTVTEGDVAPDGSAARRAFLINGQFPGPKLEMEEGDEVEVIVHSRVEKDITIHFHGITQEGTPWSDGVPGVTQLPIHTNESFTYRWTGTEPGVYWYHGHFHDAIEDGLSGPIVIHPAPGRPAPFHLIAEDENDVRALEKANRDTNVLQIRDWRHLTSEELHSHWVASNIEPLCVESVIINGKGAIVCPDEATLAAFSKMGNLTSRGCLGLDSPVIRSFSPNYPDLADPIYFSDCSPTGADVELEVIEVDRESGWASLSFVNTGALFLLTVSVDEHPLIFYSADGQYHEPVEVQSITIPTGERYQVFIKLDKPAGSAYTIRVAIPDVAQSMSGYAILKYKSPEEPVLTAAPGYPALPSSTPFISFAGTGSDEYPDTTSLDPLTIKPYPSAPPPQGPADFTLRFELNRPNGTAWAMNASGLTGTDELTPPFIWQSPQELHALANTNPGLAWTANDSIVDIVHIVAPGNPQHPIHKHFNKAFVLGAGSGEFPYETVADALAAEPGLLNLNNPPLRDGWNTPGALTEPSWLVVRYQTVNPGPNLLHCHIGQHLMGGMQIVLLEGMDVLPPLPVAYAPP